MTVGLEDLKQESQASFVQFVVLKTVSLCTWWSANEHPGGSLNHETWVGPSHCRTQVCDSWVRSFT